MEIADQTKVRALWGSLSRNIKSLRLPGFVTLQELNLCAQGELYVQQHYESAYLRSDPSNGDFIATIAGWQIQVPLPVKLPIPDRVEASIKTAKGKFSGTAFLAEANVYGLLLTGTGELGGLRESGLFPPPALTYAEILSARCGY